MTISRTSQAVAMTRAEFARPHSRDGDPDARRRFCGAGLLASAGWRVASATDAADMGTGADRGRSLLVTAGPVH